MTQATFWDKLAVRYAARPVGDQASYEATLQMVRRHLKPTDRMLEIGAGTGSTAIVLGDAVAELLSTDYAQGMIDIAAAKDAPASVRFRQARLDDLAGEAAFDVVAAFNLLHLLPDLNGDLGKVAALLKPGGVFVSKSACISGWASLMSVPIALMRALGKAPYVRMMPVSFLEAAIARAGFEIVQSDAIPAGSRNRFIVARKL